MTVVRRPKVPERDVLEWVGRFHMAATRAYLPLKDAGAREALVMAGALLTLSPTEDTFRAFCTLLLGKRRPRRWAAALAHVPATPGAVRALTDTVRAYEAAAAAGHFQSLTDANIAQLAPMVEGMLEVSSAPRPYLAACQREWYDHPVAVFSAATRRRIAPRLRGLLGDLKTDDVKVPTRRVD